MNTCNVGYYIDGPAMKRSHFTLQDIRVSVQINAYELNMRTAALIPRNASSAPCRRSDTGHSHPRIMSAHYNPSLATGSIHHGCGIFYYYLSQTIHFF